jgi:hypothetical protein
VIDGELYKHAAFGSCSGASPSPTVANLFETSTQVFVATTRCRAPSWATCSAGFYWPTAVANANEIMRTCEGCQFYARKTNLPAHALQTIPVTWPFTMWGLDIIRPLRKAPGGYTHLLVVMDKFSKWIEARPITNLIAE